jgi:2-polyprenyl-3-methyl-5-hydroxy-6-metoxy-1,4-benzoquinol methylase
LDPEFSLQYRKLYEEHWWFRAREELILAVIQREQPPGGWKSILDVGCGDGLFFSALQKFGDVEGVEPSAQVVSPDNPFRRRIYIGTFDRGFQPGKKYGLILMLDVLEHMDDPVGVIRHALSLLERDGALLITVPAFPALWTSHDVLNHHRVRYTRPAFTRVAADAGLKIVVARYFFFWLFAAKLAARVKESIFGARPQIPRVPSAPINALLGWICRAEERVLGASTIPLGGSLLVVGRNGQR